MMAAAAATALSSSSSFLNPLFDHNTLLHFSFSVFHSSSSSSSSLFCQPLRVVQHLGFIRCCTRKPTLLKHGSRDAFLQRSRLHSHESSSSKGEKPTDVGSPDGHSQGDPVDTLPYKSIAIESPSQVKQEEGDAEVKHQLLFSGDAAMKGTMVAGLLLVGVVGGFGALGYLYKEQVNEFLIQFSDVIEGFGPAGYALFIAVYAGLEILALPAIPLTMSAGLLFGTVIGTIIVSISGTIAATVAFLIARYLARGRILKFAERNKKFLAIDKAIGEDGFRVVTLLRLSPLLPFSLGNYLYGLTSVKLIPYILGSWLGMLPGSWAYVSAGALGRAFIQQEAETLGGGPEQLWTLGLGIIVTMFAAFYVTRLAKDAVKDLE